MRIPVIALFCLSLLSVTVASQADDLPLQDNAPARYTVVKGDTLWGISAKFLKDPWKWPQIWGMNKAEIKNPHWIYPGNVIVLNMHDGVPQLILETPNGNDNDLVTVKLSPTVHSEALQGSGVLPIPADMLRSFETQALVLDKDGLTHSPEIIEYKNAHIVVGAGDEVYATSDHSHTTRWKIVRADRKSVGQAIIDPVSKNILGYSADYMGDARTITPGNPQRILITSSVSEVQNQDRLVPAEDDFTFRYVPHAPDAVIDGRVISALGVLAEAGRYDSIMINKGARDSLEKGDVLAIYRAPRQKDGLKIPNSRSALCMVYRVFNKVSYALIMDSTHPVSALDVVRNP
jgi:hypothetical protein